MSDVLDRIGSINPVPQELPDSAWTASFLLDEIEARRGRTTSSDETATTPVRSSGRTWGVRIAVAAGGFMSVLAVVGVIAVMTNSNESAVVGAQPTSAPEEVLPETVDAPTTTGRVTTTTLTVATAPEAEDVAESFYEALLRGDWDAANEFAQGDLISGSNVSQLWEIQVVDVHCADAIDFVVSCTATQTDALTRQVSDAYGWQSVGKMTVVDGLVTQYTTEKQPDPIFGRYEAWLDVELPDGWLFWECSHGGWEAAECVPIYLSNVEAWLETGPDLSEIATARQKVSTAEAFYLAYLKGDWDPAIVVSDARASSQIENVSALWGIEVVAVDCEPIPAGATVTCIATQLDDLTRQISPTYTHRIEARIEVVDGFVTVDGMGPADSFFGRYEAWLDVELPDGWLFWECSHGGWGAEVCVSIYLGNFEAWLATDPDLSAIEG